MFCLPSPFSRALVLSSIICCYVISSTFTDEFPREIEKPNQHTTEDSSQPNLKVLKSSNLGFIHAFLGSLSVILVSELGDKTFFIAAIMAMRHPRLTVFSGAIAALALMTILSVTIIGGVVFLIFALTTLFIDPTKST
ncbi:hypothetical protein G9C98_006254 [Cotesia typhae]|uniref:GDT1 family protein n=1 Tax=Cotesia typhae TaxID=2053667 RepID=A0A8J5R4S2_9HYME|nr:hypothetical protein G9C98_006254 [Cotesia typhae]